MTKSELIGRGIQCKFKIDLIRFLGEVFKMDGQILTEEPRVIQLPT